MPQGDEVGGALELREVLSVKTIIDSLDSNLMFRTLLGEESERESRE